MISPCPLEAICFSSSELSRPVLADIPKENLPLAASKVTHFSISKDLVTNMDRLFGGLAHIGKLITLPAQHTYNSFLDRHDQFTRHVEHYARTAKLDKN